MVIISFMNEDNDDKIVRDMTEKDNSTINNV
jgi:hypothetical protein